MLDRVWTTIAGIILVAVGVFLENYGHTHQLPGGLGDIIIAVGTALAAVGRSTNPTNVTSTTVTTKVEKEVPKDDVSK